MGRGTSPLPCPHPSPPRSTAVSRDANNDTLSTTTVVRMLSSEGTLRNVRKVSLLLMLKMVV